MNLETTSLAKYVYLKIHKGGKEKMENFEGMNTAGVTPEAKPVEVCANCGAIIPYGSVYCSSCGKNATVKEEGSVPISPMSAPVEGKVCPKCGAAVEEGSLFCTTCGTKID